LSEAISLCLALYIETTCKAVALLTIGLFDSGVGGLSVLARLGEIMPHEDYLYFADNLHMPYGPRSPEDLREIVFAICDYLVAAGCSMIVMACNTSSALVLPLARVRYSIPLLGVLDPGARVAAEISKSGSIGVLATTATTRSGAYERSILAYRPKATVHSQACPLLAPLVEQGALTGNEVEVALKDCLAPLITAEVDTVVLGCTHYPFLRETLLPLIPSGVTLVDPAFQTAIEADNLLRQRSSGAGQTKYLVSGNKEAFVRVASSLLPTMGEPGQVSFIRDKGQLRVELA